MNLLKRLWRSTSLVPLGTKEGTRRLENYLASAIIFQSIGLIASAACNARASTSAGVISVMLAGMGLLAIRRLKIMAAMVLAWTGPVAYGLTSTMDLGREGMGYLLVLAGIPAVYVFSNLSKLERTVLSGFTVLLASAAYLTARSGAGPIGSVSPTIAGIAHIAAFSGFFATALSLLDRSLSNAKSKIQMLEKEVESASRTDPLTLLLNRMGIMERIRTEVVRFKRSQRRFCLILAGIDEFEKLKKVHGHEAADQILIEAANLFDEIVRAQDLAARWEENRFLLFLPETDLDGGTAAATRIKEILGHRKFKLGTEEMTVSMTFGISVFDGEITLDECLLAAEEAYKLGLEAGGNEIVPMPSTSFHQE